MSTVIIRAAARPLLVLLMLYSVFVLLRGHHLPGGGFIGGLVAAGAWVLHLLAHDAPTTRRALPISPRALLTAGLAIALVSGLLGALAGQPFMTGRWVHLGAAHLGSPLLFDLGVYCVVIGFALSLALDIWEAT